MSLFLGSFVPCAFIAAASISYGRPRQSFVQRPDARCARSSAVGCTRRLPQLPRLISASAYIAYNLCMQYTIRGIPSAVDAALRQRARAGGKSLNEAAVDALTEGAGMAGKPRKRRDLADIAGSWKADKAIEAALADQDLVDEDLWR